MQDNRRRPQAVARSNRVAGVAPIGAEENMRLEGEDARRFHEYMESGTITEEGREVIRAALKIIHDEEFEKIHMRWDPPV
jgi:hypothetical protein